MGFATRLALLCVTALLTIGATGSESLSQLLDRMRAKSGPVWSVHHVSFSHLTLDGETTALTTDNQSVQFRTRQCSGALCVGTYFDGARIYSVDINDTALPHSKDETYLRGVRTISSLAFLDPEFVASGGRIDDEGTARVNGVRYRSIVVTNTDAVPMRVYVDPATDLIRYFRDVNGDEALEYRDYRRVDGVLTLPYLVLNNGAILERYDVRRVESEAFPEPHGLTPTFSDAKPEVALDPDHTAPIFACTIAGVTTHCLLDTGNSGLAISETLARTINATHVGSFHVHGLGDYTAAVIRTGPLVVGNATFPAAHYAVLPGIHRFGYDVVLGADVLATTNVELDAQAHVIAFGARAPASATSVPVTFEDFVPVVAVELGQTAAQLAVDTGDESNINLSYDFYANHHDLFRATEQRTVNGVGGSSVELIGEISSVKIGDLSIGQQRIGATQMLHGTAFGHIGAGFLQHFKVILDYADGQLRLVPSDTAKTSHS